MIHSFWSCFAALGQQEPEALVAGRRVISALEGVDPIAHAQCEAGACVRSR